MTKLAVIAGDGIGPEVVAEGLKVLRALLPDVDTVDYDLGAARYHRTGETLPDAVVDELKSADAILLGAIGDPSVPPGVLERGLLLKLRFLLDHHVNLRPVKLYPGVTGPVAGPVDMVVVREGTEGPYTGNGGTLRAGTPHEVATEVSLNTAFGVERVVRDAFGRAQKRRGHLTLVHKTNVLVHAGGLWKRVFDEVAADFPDVETAYQHVDAASMFFVTDPGRFDVVVTDNLFGDIITDIGAAIGGGIGLAASGNLDVSRTNPSMFEPVHGSAPDIAGQGKADPTAAVLSVGDAAVTTSATTTSLRASRRRSRRTSVAGHRAAQHDRGRRRPRHPRRGVAARTSQRVSALAVGRCGPCCSSSPTVSGASPACCCPSSSPCFCCSSRVPFADGSGLRALAELHDDRPCLTGDGLLRWAHDPRAGRRLPGRRRRRRGHGLHGRSHRPRRRPGRAGGPAARRRWALARGLPVRAPAPGVRLLRRRLDRCSGAARLQRDRSRGGSARAGQRRGGLHLLRARADRPASCRSGKGRTADRLRLPRRRARSSSPRSGERTTVPERAASSMPRYLAPDIPVADPRRRSRWTTTPA